MALTERYVTATGTDTYINSISSLTPMSLTTALANAVAGDRINVKVGTYSRTNASDSLVNSGTATSPIVIRGYSSVIGDGFLGRSPFFNSELLTSNMPTINYTTGKFNVTGTFVILESLYVTSASTTTTVVLTGDSSVIRCTVISNGTGASSTALSMTNRSLAFDSDLFFTGATGGACAVSMGNPSSVVDACRINSSGSANGINCNGSGFITGNNIHAGPNIGIYCSSTTGAPFIRNNTITLQGGDGINIIAASTTLFKIIGNMITDNSGDGIDLNGAAVFSAYNRTRDNANAYANAGDWTTATQIGDVTTDSGGPETDYVDSASHDFGLIFTSPAVNANFPPYSSIGAFKKIAVTSGGGGGGPSSAVYGG